jgi:hypothetical protein
MFGFRAECQMIARRTMRFLVLILSLVSSAFAVEGQVFIVTQGGGNVKLGLVTIGIYPRAVFERYLAERKAAILPTFLARKAEYNEHEAARKKLTADAKRIWDQATNAHDTEAMERSIAMDKDAVRERQISEITKRECERLIGSLLNEIPVAVPTLAKTKTDADGRYKLDSVFPNDSILVASAARKVGEVIERYSWVLPTDEWESPLYLSNDNLFLLNSLEPGPELLSGSAEKRKALYPPKPEEPYRVDELVPRPPPVPDQRVSYQEYLKLHGIPRNAVNDEPTRSIPEDATIAPRVRSTLITEKTSGNEAVIVGMEAHWREYPDYISELTEIITSQWRQYSEGSPGIPPHKSHVTITFKINSKGETDIIKVEDTNCGKQGVWCCKSAIQQTQPYRKWTQEMIAVLGEDQKLTCMFYYK